MFLEIFEEAQFVRSNQTKSKQSNEEENNQTQEPKQKENSQATKTQNKTNHSEQNKTINFISSLRLIVTENGSKTKTKSRTSWSTKKTRQLLRTQKQKEMIARKKNYFEVKPLGAAAAAKGVRR